MTKVRKAKLVGRHQALTRLLSFLLLGFIVYGTTVEAAHTHGNLASANTITGVSNMSDPATETNTTTNFTGCGDCLICQLHQNFSATVLSVPPGIAPPSLPSVYFNPTTISVHSQTSRPRTGRAPPQASL